MGEQVGENRLRTLCEGRQQYRWHAAQPSDAGALACSITGLLSLLPALVPALSQ